MKKLLAGFLGGFLAIATWQYAPKIIGVAKAVVPCSVPFNFTNGTIIDATQVNSNYTAILQCLSSSAAASGINADITSLIGLTTPIPAAGGGTTNYIGADSTGTNTIAVATTTPTGFALTKGFTVKFKAGGSNTAASTLNVNSLGNINFYRQTPSGPVPMVGGEIVAGQSVSATYDGTQFQLTSTPALNYPPGVVFDYASASGCPAGSLEALGTTTVSQTTYPTLFALLSTTWGAAAGGNFTIPDLRGRSTFSRDSGGSARITVAGGNFDGTTIGNTGGRQNFTITTTQLPSYNLGYTDPGHTHGISPQSASVATTTNVTPSGGFTVFQAANGASATQSATVGITIHSGGGDGATPVLSNAAIVLKCIKA